MNQMLKFIVLVMAGAVLPACASTSIALRESVLGQAKRDQLVNRVTDAREAQSEAKVQFASALDEFIAVTGAGADAQVADLEGKYKKLKASYERSESRASTVKDRITSVERVASSLFREWQNEIGEYQSAALKQSSEQQLNETKGQYERLIGAMKQAEGKMTPVLAAFKDQVLFLKHNLNARAIASLQGTAMQVQNDVAGLIREMEASIAEADSFINQMQSGK